MRVLAGLAALAISTSSLPAQNWVTDEGTFVVLKNGAATLTESFKITRAPDGLITATGNQTSGTQQITSSLTTDNTGTPVQYELNVRKAGARVAHVRALSGSGRLRAQTTAPGEESTHEYPLTTGQCVILEPGLLHQFYFLALQRPAGRLQVVEPRSARMAALVVTPKGLEPITIAQRSVTATRYQVTGGGTEAEFWVDAQGRLLRVDIPSQGLSATREEPPR